MLVDPLTGVPAGLLTIVTVISEKYHYNNFSFIYLQQIVFTSGKQSGSTFNSLGTYFHALLFKPGTRRLWHCVTGFWKSFLFMHLYVCVFVCLSVYLPPRALITSGVI